ncbi:MAG TPA: VOC family protein [Rhizomicrobium sp.]|jgi:catechol 2,3-dioxygenase-like lactoylglutathione lyase family enzyme
MQTDSVTLPPIVPLHIANGVVVSEVRIARPTDRLEDVVRFYRDGLGLPELCRFSNHEGYDGVMIGLPGRTYHLEFTQHRGGSPSPAPTRDNLLVLYIPDITHFEQMRTHLISFGHEPVAPENPYWRDKSVTFEDPDGWRVVLCNLPGI